MRITFWTNILEIQPIITEIDHEDQDGAETVYTNQEKSIITIKFSENVLNTYLNEIIIINQDRNPSTDVLKRILST